MATKGRVWLGFILILILAGLFVLSVLIDLGLEGTDDQASLAIGALCPEYQPWFHNFFEPGERGEKTLFALQILLGVGLGGYSLWRLRRGTSVR
ncbi:MAG: energy-coupling factor ABC transporter substrate-binding protein [Atribacterota bacterium]|nr:energy-coupling factor ABC transporter substrate-binding protein [Atribacterota bacterium]